MICAQTSIGDGQLLDHHHGGGHGCQAALLLRHCGHLHHGGGQAVIAMAVADISLIPVVVTANVSRSQRSAMCTILDAPLDPFLALG
jgi:hypothetical protein